MILFVMDGGGTYYDFLLAFTFQIYHASRFISNSRWHSLEYERMHSRWLSLPLRPNPEPRLRHPPDTTTHIILMRGGIIQQALSTFPLRPNPYDTNWQAPDPLP